MLYLSLAMNPQRYGANSLLFVHEVAAVGPDGNIWLINADGNKIVRFSYPPQ